MYEKLMYKVPSKDNKVIYRLQDFTKNDNVEESYFVEGKNSKGDKRLQCQVHVLHTEELERIHHEQDMLKDDIKELNNKIMKKNIEIKRLEREIAEHKRANIVEDIKLKDEKYNMLVSHQKAVDKLNETHANDLSAIDKTHRKHLENMRSQYNTKVNELNEHLFESVKANGKVRDNLRAEMLAMSEEHKDKLVSLQKEHHEELETLQHEHSNELQTLREQHQYDIDTLKTALADVKQEHLVEVNKINERHHVEVDKMRTDFLKLLTNEHAQDLSDFNECGELPFYVKPFARAFVNAFDEFKKRKETNSPRKIVETYELAPARDE